MSQIDMSKLPEGATVHNDAEIEMNWAKLAFEYSETYERLLTILPTERIKFTPFDDKIYEAFRTAFPHVDVKVIDVDSIKSKENKLLWFPVLKAFESIKNFNFASLCRIDASRPFGPDNSVVVPRIQYYMFELARLREGANAEFIKQLKAAKK